MQIDRLDKSLSDENKYMEKKRILFSFWLLLAVLSVSAQNNVETQRQYLSGHGCDDMVNWQFYCTSGRNSGKWTTIGVPSCWELQGFGTYQYGMRFYGKADPPGIADEKGRYKYEFYLPSQWKGRQIQLAFEAVMTDAKVTINGRKGGHHQGGFYRFILDVSDRVYFGKHKNLLEVEVSKESANPDVNLAERRGDYWNFGGIIRPVFVIAKPVLNIDRVAVDAGMDGHFKADCFLNRAVSGAKIKTEIFDGTGRTGAFQGARVGTSMTDCRSSDEAHVDLMIARPKLWTAETPNLYTAVFTLEDASGKVLHREYQKFGFRTIEYRTSDGVYVNGKKVIFKGVNRHSLRPESGRTLSKAKCIEDVNLIKSMNMNAVRLSHYPADPEFYDACDSLGLYVMDELTGWHHAYDTATGQELVKEMVTRDVNHPSIIFWSNGNEGGFNYELQPELYDDSNWQKRVVEVLPDASSVPLADIFYAKDCPEVTGTTGLARVCKSKIVMSSPPTDRAYEGDVVRLTLENCKDINGKAVSQLYGKATPISYNTYVIDVYTGRAGSSAVVCTEAAWVPHNDYIRYRKLYRVGDTSQFQM